MRIPADIKAVKRPVNTVVRDYFGKYKVVKRTCKYINKKPTPVDKEIVGEIINFEFVAYQEPIPVGIRSSNKENKGTDIKDYGNIKLFTSKSDDILESLKKHFDPTTAIKLYVISIIRCCFPKATNSMLKHFYDTSFLSEDFPKVGLSESMLPDFFEKTGRAYSAIENFMIDRINSFNGKVQIIDGTLKSYNSSDSAFSAWSRKGRIKGSKDFSLIYTYDLESREPIYHRPYAGNMLDSTIFNDYLNNIPNSNGILIGDKGFKTEFITEKINTVNKLKYLFPLKRKTRILKEENIATGLVPVAIKDKQLLGKKLFIDNKFYYYFKDLEIESIEKKSYYFKQIKKENFDSELFKKEVETYGTIFFESNTDLTLEEVFIMYDQRWEIEKMFNFYKNILELSATRVHTDMRVYTTEFINYLSLIIGCRVKNNLVKLGLDKKYSFKQILELLKSYKMQYTNGQWRSSQLLKYVEELVKQLNI